jgi:hypothetical protein
MIEIYLFSAGRRVRFSILFRCSNVNSMDRPICEKITLTGNRWFYNELSSSKLRGIGKPL